MRNLRALKILAIALTCSVCGLSGDALAQAKNAAPPTRKMTKPTKLINRQPPPIVNKELEDVINQENSRAVVSLSKQRLYLMTGDQVYIDTPISSGKRGNPTPQGYFTITQKNADHRSNLYGAFVDRKGRVIRSGVSSRSDSAPSGTRFLGAPMKYFCRLSNSAVGFHVGLLPGYPASHGCIRLPEQIAPLVYNKVKVGTKVRVEP